jgi:hypothetical protein
MSLLDPTDRDLAKKRAREAAEHDTDPTLVDAYIKDNPSLDKDGYPIDAVAYGFDVLYEDLYGLAGRAFDDDSHLAQWDDDPSPYSGTYSED